MAAITRAVTGTPVLRVERGGATAAALRANAAPQTPVWRSRQFLAAAASLLIVVLDLTMPGLGGMEVLSRLRERRPDLPVIIASGYAESSAPGIASDPRVRYLQKPFGIKMLLRAVDELLL